jgi:DNA-binding response OmpR family regulator
MNPLAGLVVRPRDGVVSWEGGETRLTAQEMAVFEVLRARAPGFASVRLIGDLLYSHRAEPPRENNIGIFVLRIRRKLADAGAPFGIETRRDFGYALTRARGQYLGNRKDHYAQAR